MLRVLYFVVLGSLCCLSFIASLPLESHTENDPELTAGYFEGDMMLDEQRNGLIDEAKRWPNNTVYYKIETDRFDTSHIQHIHRAMQIIESVSCIRFREGSTDKTAYVKITAKSNGCSSSVGYMNRIQGFNLIADPIDTGCFRLGVIVHELLHTLGLYHMQSASDRDDYVRIMWQNINPITVTNFQKYDTDKIDSYDVEYDYDSILHYSPYAFTRSGEQTIVPLRGDVEDVTRRMGQRKRMTASDIRRLNVMYKCVREL